MSVAMLKDSDKVIAGIRKHHYSYHQIIIALAPNITLREPEG
jgi:hypothetical protein